MSFSLNLSLRQPQQGAVKPNDMRCHPADIKWSIFNITWLASTLLLSSAQNRLPVSSNNYRTQVSVLTFHWLLFQLFSCLLLIFADMMPVQTSCREFHNLISFCGCLTLVFVVLAFITAKQRQGLHNFA